MLCTFRIREPANNKSAQCSWYERCKADIYDRTLNIIIYIFFNFLLKPMRSKAKKATKLISTFFPHFKILFSFWNCNQPFSPSLSRSIERSIDVQVLCCPTSHNYKVLQHTHSRQNWIVNIDFEFVQSVFSFTSLNWQKHSVNILTV